MLKVHHLNNSRSQRILWLLEEIGAPYEIVHYKRGTPIPGKLKPKAGTDDYWKYVEWLHYEEGSAMLPLLLALYTGMLGDAAAALKPRVDSEIANNLAYMENALIGQDFFVGKELTGADIQILFVLEAAGARLEPYPNLVKYRARMQARPAYQRGIEKGGPYQLMSR